VINIDLHNSNENTAVPATIFLLERSHFYLAFWIEFFYWTSAKCFTLANIVSFTPLPLPESTIYRPFKHENVVLPLHCLFMCLSPSTRLYGVNKCVKTVPPFTTQFITKATSFGPYSDDYQLCIPEAMKETVQILYNTQKKISLH